MLAGVRAQRRARDAAEARILELAGLWADAHPDPGGDVFEPVGPGPLEETAQDEWHRLPSVAWQAPAALGASLGRSTTAGRILIRHALTLRERLPHLWDRVLAGEVECWRARRVAEAMTAQPDDVVAYLDTVLTDRAHRIGTTALDNLIDEAKLRLHAEARELEQLEALDARHATVHDKSINHTGVTDMTIRADWADLALFDDALTRVATALAATCVAASGESLNVRRTLARAGVG